MTITLTGPVEQQLQNAVAEGSYRDANEAVQTALFLMWMREEENAAKPAPVWLKEMLADGLQGSAREVSDLDAYFVEIQRKAGL